MVRRNLIIIPARSGSKRVKNKNVREFKGKALIYYSIIAAQLANIDSEIIVSTDCPICENLALKMGVTVYNRPDFLNTDTASSLDVTIHVCKKYIAQTNIEPEFIILLQPTSPLRRKSLIEDGVMKLANTPTADSLVSVFKSTLFTGEIKNGFWVPDYTEDTRSQDLTEKFVPTGNLFIYRYKTTISKGTALGHNTIPLVEDNSIVVNIDEEKDFFKLDQVFGLFKAEFRHLFYETS